MLNENNLLNNFSDFSALANRVINNNLYDENWLLLYESCRREWLNKDDAILMNDPFFKQLHQNNVSFISSEGSSSEIEVINNLINASLKRFEKDITKTKEEILESVIREKGWTIIEGIKTKILSKIELKSESIENSLKSDETDSEASEEVEKTVNGTTSETSGEVEISADETESKSSLVDENQVAWIIKLLNTNRDEKHIDFFEEEDY